MTTLAVIVYFAVHGAPSSGPPRPYAADARAAYVREALAALQATDPTTLAQAKAYIGAVSQSACTSAFARLRVECTMSVARRYCAAKKGGSVCSLYADVIASRALAEDYFLSSAARYALLQQSRDPRGAIERELRRMEGELAVDMRLSSCRCATDDTRCLALAIDGFCVAAGDEHDLPWQACVAALTWFIGTTPR